MKTKIFFDMDGVLADIHAEENFYERMHEKGFFARLKAFRHAMQAMNNLNDNPNFDVYILSHSISEQCRREKSRWLDWTARDLPRDRIFIIDIEKSKSEFVREKFGEFDKTFVLFDDYNKNLMEWEKAGGTAILCENNTAYLRPEYSKWSGKCVSNSNPAEQIIGDLKSAISEIQCEKTMIFRIYNKVYPQFFGRNYYGDLDEHPEEIPSHEIYDKIDELNEIVAAHSETFNERGLMEYYSENDGVNAKIKSIFQHFDIIETGNGDDVFFVSECTIKDNLTAEEIEKLKESIAAQNSDGFGEGLEQQDITLNGGILNVSVWNSDGDYAVMTGEEFVREFGAKIHYDDEFIAEKFYVKLTPNFYDDDNLKGELTDAAVLEYFGSEAEIKNALNDITLPGRALLEDFYLENYAPENGKIQRIDQNFEYSSGEAILITECKCSNFLMDSERNEFKQFLHQLVEQPYGQKYISDNVKTAGGELLVEVFRDKNCLIMTENEYQNYSELKPNITFGEIKIG